MQAYERLLADGIGLRLDLYGSSDSETPEAVLPQEILAWCQRTGPLVWTRIDVAAV